jgi:hypothetical protein
LIIQRASSTFCWLPPESFEISWSIEGVLIWMASAIRRTSLIYLRRLMLRSLDT